MFRPLRTLISLALLAGLVWFSFAVELGDMTLAEHVDRISATPEAEHLLEGTRETVNPAIEDVRDRMLGEYVEAPTGAVLAEPVEATPSAVAPAAPEPQLPRRRLRARSLARVDLEVEPVSEPSPAGPAGARELPAWPGARSWSLAGRLLALMPAPRQGPAAPVRLIEPRFVAAEPELPGA